MADNGNSMVTDFRALINRVEEKTILLPDFQREFVWRDEEMQRKLVASVLAKMPVGSILLLSGSPDDYSCKTIGRRTTIPEVDHDSVDFLLDGQQRITVLSNVFSNVIFDNNTNYNQLISPMALKRRFFLKVPKWISSNQEKDLFNVRTLDFPEEFSSKEPEFLSGDILKNIHVVSFTASDNKPYNPAVDLSPELSNFCIGNTDGYLIPLFLLVSTGDASKKQRIQLILKRTITLIADQIQSEIKNELLKHPLGSVERNSLIDEVFAKCTDEERAAMKSDAYGNKLETELQDKTEYWYSLMTEYLNSCIREMRLTQICVDGTQRARAIDIYENLNRGGVSLNTFDLIMARVAKVDRRNFFERIVDCMKAEKHYKIDVVPGYISNQLKPLIDNRVYNATIRTGCYLESRNEIASRYIDVFLDVLGLYFNNQKFEPDVFRVDHIKRDKILNIDSLFIHQNCEKVITAIDRAMFFFQSRCGIRNIQEINYSLMIVLISTIFLNDQYFSQKKYHDLLEAWYWCVLFNGDYDKDQNAEMIRDLGFFFQTFKGDRNVDWLNTKKDGVFDRQFFSDKDLLLMNRAELEERLPKAIIKNFVCQFFLSKTYSSMFDDSRCISVFCDESATLEAHHIIPLGSVTSIGESTKKLRNDDSNICNSPLNFAYITKEDNNKIGAKNLHEYASMVKTAALSKLCIQSAFTDSDFTSNEKVKNILENRFSSTKGDVESRIIDCLNSWS